MARIAIERSTIILPLSLFPPRKRLRIWTFRCMSSGICPAQHQPGGVTCAKITHTYINTYLYKWYVHTRTHIYHTRHTWTDNEDGIHIRWIVSNKNCQTYERAKSQESRKWTSAQLKTIHASCYSCYSTVQLAALRNLIRDRDTQRDTHRETESERERVRAHHRGPTRQVVIMQVQLGDVWVQVTDTGRQGEARASALQYHIQDAHLGADEVQHR